MDKGFNSNIYLTIDEKVMEGDYGLGLAMGIKNRAYDNYEGRGFFPFKHNSDNKGKLNAICNGTKKIIASNDLDLPLIPNIPDSFIYVKSSEIYIKWEDGFEYPLVDIENCIIIRNEK